MGKKQLKMWLLIIIVIMLPTYCFCADITYQPYYQDLENIYVNGEIATGDYEKLVSLIKLNPDKFVSSRTVVLNSNGGNVIESIKIGELFKKTFKSVEVKGVCASSCFFIYIGAVERSVNESSKLGIHRPYFPKEMFSGLKPNKAEQLQNDMMKKVRKYLSDSFVPQYLIDNMFMKSSSDIYWLNDKDINEGLGYYSMWYEEFISAKCNYNVVDVIKNPDGNMGNIKCKRDIESYESKAYISLLISDLKMKSKNKKPKWLVEASGK